VVRGLSRDADAVTSTRGGGNDAPIVCTHKERPVLHICQVFSLGLSLTNVVDAAVRRVGLGLPVPSLVEVLAYPLISEKKECSGMA